ncbi:MAG: enoyl-ACP reductase [Nitrospirota bacterium]|nr:enoyl-ACP reductase [Nitrospirota bacterium]
MGLMQGKRGVILGVANNKSIAWGVAQSLVREGASVALTYMNEAIEKRLRPLADELGASLVLPCDAGSDEQIATAMRQAGERLGGIDFLVHSIAYADKEDLKHPLVQTRRENFRMSMDISAYTLVALCREAQPFFSPGASVLTLSFYGAEKVMPNYNVMGVAKAALEASVRYLASDLGPSGVRVNALSAGPIRTLAASGISDFRDIQRTAAERAPLRRNVEIDEVGDAALYLLSPLSRGVTGEIHYVDAGYNVIGM